MAKKPYSKPVIEFDYYELNSMLAYGCEVIGNFASPDTCGWLHPYYGEIVFQDKWANPCTFQRPGGGYEWGDLWVCVYTHEDTLFTS